MNTELNSGLPTPEGAASDGENRRAFMKTVGGSLAAVGAVAAWNPVLAAAMQRSAGIPADADNFYKSSQVTIRKVSFKNQCNMRVVGNLVAPKSLDPNGRARCCLSPATRLIPGNLAKTPTDWPPSRKKWCGLPAPGTLTCMTASA